MKLFTRIAIYSGLLVSLGTAQEAVSSKEAGKYNVLFIISDDLTAKALSCYENPVCKTPHIDSIAKTGTRYTNTFCQLPICGPSRASMMTGYYPNATNMFGYSSGRKQIGDKRHTWAQHFKNNGYYTARVSKIYHMGVPGDIEKGTDGTDDPASWTEKFNSKGSEVFCEGKQIQLVNNPEAKPPTEVKIRGGNTQEVCIADGDELLHSDGKTAVKASELIKKHKDKRFFLAVGMVRPHIPFVAPKKYFEMYPWEKMVPEKKWENDWDDIPRAGINYRTGKGMNLSDMTEKMSLQGYYASVTYMDDQVGRILNTLKEEGLEDETIVIFTSDHGFHLGEHDFWQKVGLMDESSRVPMIIKVPGQKAAVCESFTELIDLYPTISSLCGLEIPSNIQGKDISKSILDPTFSVRDFAFCVNKQGGGSFLIRSEKWAYIQHGENAENGAQLYNMEVDSLQVNNLYENPEYAEVVIKQKELLKQKLKDVRTNDLEIDYSKPKKKRKSNK